MKYDFEKHRIEIIKNGFSRTVMLFGNYAFKFPKASSWYSFTQGLAANYQEYFFWKTGSVGNKSDYCPTLFSLGGFINIMPRCCVCTSEEEIEKLPFEPYKVHKVPKNFGYYKGRIVVLDYAIH